MISLNRRNKSFKYFLVFIQAIITTSLYCQDIPDSTQKRIDVLIKKFKSEALNAQENKEIKDLTYKIQNKGFTLQEKDHDYQNSLVYIDKALDIWIAINDTPNEANNRKFRGMLLGYLNRFPEAKKEAHIAINQFASIKRYYGVAVSQNDLSIVFELEGVMDSAFYYANAALAYWKNTNNTFRKSAYTNHTLNLLYKSKDFTRAEQLLRESEPLFQKKDLEWQQLIDYYYLAARIYEKLHRNKIAGKYKTLYDKKIESLKKENISANSAYL